jgi:20S proteasome subunit beta 4
LLGGYDITTDIPHLYWIDYLGTKAVVNYGAHGAGMYVALSTMDKWWYPEMDKEAGMKLLQKCIDEVQHRASSRPLRSSGVDVWGSVLTDRNGDQV